MKVFQKIKLIWAIIKETFVNWNKSDPFRLSAVVAYYAVFSLPGLLLIVVTVTGYLVGEELVKGEIYKQANELIGEQGANQLQTMIQNAYESKSSTIATIAGLAIILFSASNLFFHLKISLNSIWGVEAQPQRAWLKLIKDRAFSYGLMLAISFLLLLSLVLTSLIAAFSGTISNLFGVSSVYVFQLTNELISLCITTALFAAIFKFLPDIIIRWKDVLVGSFISALLFGLGKFFIGLLLGQSNPGATYGAAGSIILILIWFTYSSLIFFLGAEFTQVYARKLGKQIRPKEFAVQVDKGKRDFAKAGDQAQSR
ncbi:YihY/virulence factor BrkB family protein [Rhodocytophaga aerolata]|uniref:YihY/virulence factor BrkB family protein n=2 Tax=Rhodocytophaga aerolata TaxID=455078 RepID=A0ABT8RHM2_9BACT|nr:YihY/virulence factor BrkB family protein [Rhodocytophaga aerolata]